MDKIVSSIEGAPQTRSKNDDDFADRLSSRYTVILLVVFSILVSMNQYVRTPITCWAPVHFTGAHTKFTTNYCWVKNTYYLPWSEEIPRGSDPDKRQMIPYYQWIPFILLAQAMMFYFPSVVWHALNSRAGVDADNILAAAHTFSRTDRVETRDKTMAMLVNQMERFLDSRKKGKQCNCDLKSVVSATCCSVCGRRLGNYLQLLFLFSKVCYIANVIGQLFLLNVVLGMKFESFGFDITRHLIEGHDWTEDSYVAFPRVTLCDFQIRGQDMANVHTYTVQCVLPVNLYNEKMYIFLWYWMVIVAAISVLSFIVWFLRGCIQSDRVRFIRNHLKLGSRLERANEDHIERFTVEYLKQDGTLLMRLVAHNSNNITTTEVICALWDSWSEKDSERRLNNGDEAKRLSDGSSIELQDDFQEKKL